MRYFRSGLLALAALAVFGGGVFAQETEERVIDEVVAQVNDGVITLSRVNREVRSIVDAGVQQGKKREDAQREVESKRGELIANLINEELMMQRAKEANLESEVEAGINRRFLDMMKQNNIKTLEILFQEMEKAGVNPQQLREIWRTQLTRDLLLQREVYGKIYWGIGAKELKEYYEKNKARFTKPETVSVSEIFLGYAGRDEAAVREKAKQLVAQLRSGADFAKLASENSDPGQLTQGKGKEEKMKVSDIPDVVAKPLKDVKVGGVTDPIEIDQLGVIIVKVDAREQASSESYFDENAVRMAIVNERGPEEQKKFMSTLRGDAYIKISDTYRPLVAPLLFAEERKEKASNDK